MPSRTKRLPRYTFLRPGKELGVDPTLLTHRQEEIARLVAQGLTNRQIASKLSISEHTVATHVAKILEELGIRLPLPNHRLGSRAADTSVSQR